MKYPRAWSFLSGALLVLLIAGVNHLLAPTPPPPHMDLEIICETAGINEVRWHANDLPSDEMFSLPDARWFEFQRHDCGRVRALWSVSTPADVWFSQ